MANSIDSDFNVFSEYISVDYKTGKIFWKAQPSTKIKVGDEAGSDDRHGYRKLCFRKRMFLVHRVVFLLANGRWPIGQIDHINGNRKDNRIENLRDATHSLNMQNQRKAMSSNHSSGLLGVTLHKCGKWQALIKTNGKSRYIGLFPTPEEAHAAYILAKRELHDGCTI